MFRVTDQFEFVAKLQDEKNLQRKKWFIAAKSHQEQKVQKQERAEGALEDFGAAMIVAEEIELQEFKADLDLYDEATVKAIIENRDILERLILERDTLLARAYVLEDGTRVFKSEDGEHVYDESGNHVAEEIIDPEQIPDHHPKAEPYLQALDSIKKHEAIQHNLHDYQAKLDEARERTSSGEMTQQELEDYRDELKRAIPIEVNRQLPEFSTSSEHDTKPGSTTMSKPTAFATSDMAINPELIPGM